MTKTRVYPETAPKKNELFTEKGKKFKSKQNVAKRDKFFKPSLSGSRSFFSESSEKQNASTNVKPKEFFIKPGAKLISPRDESQAAKQHFNEDLDKTKKPFDKKKYRLKKYSKKYKLQQWEDKRKHAILQEYYRQVKDDQPVDVSKIYEYPRNQESKDDNLEEDNKINLETSNIQTILVHGKTSKELNSSLSLAKIKAKPFQRAQHEFQRIKEERLRKKEEFLKSKAEKQDAMKEYKKNKVEKYKKLLRKTKKGQPIMKDRIEILLEKIQSRMM